MSAGFVLAGEFFWGTNGAVETYVEALAELAVARFGAADSLAVYLAERRDSFSMGGTLFLDEWVADEASRARFLQLLDAATEQLLRGDTFTEYGREWVASMVSQLRARIAGVHP